MHATREKKKKPLSHSRISGRISERENFFNLVTHDLYTFVHGWNAEGQRIQVPPSTDRDTMEREDLG